MSLNPTQISVISATKVDPKKLSVVGDSAAAAEVPGQMQEGRAAERRCNLCCVAYGTLIDTVMVLFLTSSITGISIHAEKRVNYSLNGAMRQVAWLSFPGTFCAVTLHYFLSEAMWSGKKNSWGQAWIKAMVMNTILWCSGVGLSTLLWRKVMPLTAAGRRLYHRFPIPTDPLEARLLRSSKQFFTGMGWSYWISGVASGHMGLMTVVAFCIYNDRPYMMMAPEGNYAKQCMPLWRRQQLALMANVALPGATAVGAAADGRESGGVGATGIARGKGVEVVRKGPTAGGSGGNPIT